VGLEGTVTKAAVRKTVKKAANSEEAVAARVREYLAAQPPGTRRVLKRIRDDVRIAAPDAVEVFSYGLPGFRYLGKPLIWTAGWKEHISLYPIGEAIVRAHATDLEGCGFSRGTVRFPLDGPPSSALVKRLVKARMAQVQTGEAV
jgi:uncharacterized protein YdhG (YjbR/CyaY superfamily)